MGSTDLLIVLGAPLVAVVLGVAFGIVIPRFRRKRQRRRGITIATFTEPGLAVPPRPSRPSTPAAPPVIRAPETTPPEPRVPAAEPTQMPGARSPYAPPVREATGTLGAEWAPPANSPAAEAAPRLRLEPPTDRIAQPAERSGPPANERAAPAAAQRAAPPMSEPGAERAVPRAAQGAVSSASERATERAVPPAAQRATPPLSERATERAILPAAERATERVSPTPLERLIPTIPEPAKPPLRVHRPPADGTLQFLTGRLEIIEGRDLGQEIRFVRQPGPGPTEVTFGRQDGVPYRHVQLHEPTVSRLHARMTLEGINWRLTNLSRTNPITVNGASMAPENTSVLLREGDRIEMGEVVFRFHAK